MNSFVFLLIVPYLMCGEAKPGKGRIATPELCSIPSRERVGCGNEDISEADCKNYGCCWTPCHGCPSSISWCHQSKDMLREECAVPSGQKVECGFVGITEPSCFREGCCWTPSPVSGDPWCFREGSSTPRPYSTDSPVITSGNDGDVRLAGEVTHDYEGRVEISIGGGYGTVCDDAWDDRDATVVCKQLGYASGTAMSNSAFGEGSGPIHLDEVGCDGSESSLLDCSHWGVGDHDCSHSEDAGVTCSHESITDAEDGEIRLVGGSEPYEGRVEIFHAGSWGSVCDDNWDDTDATVVCKQLGYSSGIAKTDAHFGEGTGHIWMDEVQCYGEESSLSNCDFECWNCEDCSHSEDAGVICDEDDGGSGSGSGYYY